MPPPSDCDRDTVITQLSTLRSDLAALDRLMEARFGTNQAMLNASNDKIQLALEAVDKAGVKAETATEKRFDSVNEFRAQLSDQSRTFITRDVFDNTMASSMADRHGLHEDINTLRLKMAQLVDRSQVQDLIGSVEAGVRRNHADIERLANQNTRVVGVAIGVSFMMSLVGVLVAVVLRLASG